MTYTVISAAYAEASCEHILAQTVEAGAVVFNEKTRPELWSAAQKIGVSPFKERKISYAEARALEYPALADGLDALVKKEAGDPEAWASYVSVCLAVKARHPKDARNG